MDNKEITGETVEKAHFALAPFSCFESHSNIP